MRKQNPQRGHVATCPTAGLSKALATLPSRRTPTHACARPVVSFPGILGEEAYTSSFGSALPEQCTATPRQVGGREGGAWADGADLLSPSTPQESLTATWRAHKCNFHHYHAHRMYKARAARQTDKLPQCYWKTRPSVPIAGGQTSGQEVYRSLTANQDYPSPG